MSYHPSSEIGYNRVSSPLVVEKTNGQVTSVRRSPPKQLAYSQPSQHANFYESQPPIANGGQQRLHHSVEKTLGKSTDSSSGPQIYENYPDIKDFINTAASFQRGEQAKVIRAKQPIPLPQVAVGQPVKVGSGSNRPGYDHNRPSMASPMYSPQEIGDQSGSYDSAMLSRKTASSTTGSSHSVSSEPDILRNYL